MPRLTHIALLLTLALAPAVAQDVPAPPTAQETVYTRDEVTTPAVIVSMPAPVVEAKKGKLLDLNGTVKVSVVLSSSGQVRDARILEGLAQSQNFAALKAARRITFMPAQKDGRPVAQAYVAEYRFSVYTEEYGSPAELKGLSKFYVDAGGEALADITGELQRLLPQLILVDSPEQAECFLRFSSHDRFDRVPLGNAGTHGPQTVNVGRGWVVKPLAADRQRQLMYYDNSKYSFVERRPAKNFARAFVYEYKRANGLGD